MSKNLTKSQKTQLILKLLNDKGFTWEVLSRTGDIPNHIRVKDFGDVWPSTGTFSIKGKFHKRNFERLVEALGGGLNFTDNGPTTKQRLVKLEELNAFLIARVEELENDVYELKKAMSAI